MGPLITSIDGALPRSPLARVIAGVRAVGSSARYDRTFWHPFHSPPTNVIEAAIPSLAMNVPGGVDGIAGIEWWIGRMFTTRVPLDFHHDRDLRLYETTGRMRHPVWSSVLFLNRVRGGSLAVTDQRLVKSKNAFVLRPPNPRSFETVRPEPNRFAVFRGNLFHGVLDANDETPHSNLPGAIAAPRLTVVVNWWDRRPMGVKTWSESRAYRALKLPTE